MRKKFKPLQFKRSDCTEKLKARVEKGGGFRRLGPISLKEKAKNLSNNFGIRRKELGIYESDENILKTPSTVNDNSPLSLDFLDQSLNNYYESEVNPYSLKKNSITPAPHIKYRLCRPVLPKIVTKKRVKLHEKELPKVGRTRSTSNKKRKTDSSEEITQNTRYFSRRVRKSKSPTIKFIYISTHT